MCFFAETSTASAATSSTHSYTHTHTHTHTRSHLTGQQWLTGQVVPDFSGLVKKNFFDPEMGSAMFLTDRGSRNIRKYYPQRVNCFFLFMFVFLRRHYAAQVFDG